MKLELTFRRTLELYIKLLHIVVHEVDLEVGHEPYKRITEGSVRPGDQNKENTTT